MSKVNPIPPMFHAVTPHLIIDGCAKAIDFYKKAFGAEEISRMPAPDGQRLMHAMIKIGNSVLMLCDDFPEWGAAKSPKALGQSSVTLHMYVPDADASFKRALDAGATVSMPIADMFWGDRYGIVKDPFGHEWSIATHIKDMTGEEMMQAMKQMCG